MQKPPSENDSKVQVDRQNSIVFEVFGGQGGQWQEGQFSMSVTGSDWDDLGSERWW